MRWITLALLLAVGLPAGAQSLSNRYSSLMGEGSMIYFFRPKRLSECEGIKSFTYDITYKVNEDSVTLNFSVINKEATKIRTLDVGNGEHRVSCDNVSTLYRDARKKNYDIRTSARMSFDDLRTLCASQRPPAFQAQTADGQTIRAAYKASQWKKERNILTRILNSLILD